MRVSWFKSTLEISLLRTHNRLSISQMASWMLFLDLLLKILRPRLLPITLNSWLKWWTPKYSSYTMTKIISSLANLVKAPSCSKEKFTPPKISLTSRYHTSKTVCSWSSPFTEQSPKAIWDLQLLFSPWSTRKSTFRSKLFLTSLEMLQAIFSKWLASRVLSISRGRWPRRCVPNS